MPELGAERCCEGTLVEYQPVFDLGSGQVRTMTAHARTKNEQPDQDRGDEVEPIARRLMPMERFRDLLDEAFCALTTWLGEESDHRVSVSVSQTEVTDPAFVDVVERAWKSHGLRGRTLELVLDETTTDACGDTEVVERLEVLSGLGVRFVFCDAGQDRAKLFALRAFPGHRIRLHDHVLENLESDPAMRVLSVGMTQFAHALGQTVSARDVATNGQLSLLRDASCDEVQGSLFGSPSSEPQGLLFGSLPSMPPQRQQSEKRPPTLLRTPSAPLSPVDIVGTAQLPGIAPRSQRSRLLSGRHR